MLKMYVPTEAELMELAKAALRNRSSNAQRHIRSFNPVASPNPGQFLDKSAVDFGPRPAVFVKPRFGTPAYAAALKAGWITAEEERGDRQAWEERRKRSLQTCHRASIENVMTEEDAENRDRCDDSGAYVPQLSARIEDDPHLTDGARRCARKIAELTYRQSREERSLDVTVTYLMKALGRSRRTIQRYLRVLERERYIRVTIIASSFSRMSVGLVVEILAPMFARHHREGWPPKTPPRTEAKSGASRESHNQSKYFSLDYYKDRNLMFSVEQWSARCMDGVFRALRECIPIQHVASSPS